ncbi:unnamed protein product [Mytilus coruscus]|uniref:Endonuclease/exonuclease/phosphatase domain-containing protein n=1 Tax=Mytilus coruscus TaxID=42192 RepID=A0A6J8EHD2_MYTCO|nr:unnamed protein product [Mytilus coruscus]
MPDGNERIIVIALNTKVHPICLINVYMPSGNENCDDKYKDMLAQLEEIIEKYQEKYHIMLCGDLNASLHRDNRSRDMFLKQFIINNELELENKYPIKPTFYNHNKISKSQIDYFLHKRAVKNIQYTVSILNIQPLNVSDHTIVIAEVIGILNRKQRQITKMLKRPDWRKCDKDIYQETIATKLKEIDFTTIKTTTEAIENLENIFHHRGNLSMPKYRKQSIVTTNGKSIWNQDINNASRKSKEAFYLWKQDHQNHELKNEMQTAKRQLRSAQRRTQALKRIALQRK